MNKLYNTQLHLTSGFTKFFLKAIPDIRKSHLNILPFIIFGMIMKTHPQFNLLVIGFPVKIAIAFVVLVLTISTIMYTFKNELKNAFFAVGKIFLGQ